MSLNDHLKTSQKGLDLITKWEGIVLKQYICPAGKLTIGIGHVIQIGKESFPEKITKEFALQLLEKDVERFENAIKKHVKVKLNQNQFDALVTFLFNVGEGGIINSGVQKELNAGNYDKVPDKMLEWCKFTENGVLKVNKGLQNRRKAEGQLFSTPVKDPEILIEKQPQVTLVPWTVDLLKAVQLELKNLKLYTIKIDGLFGPGTLNGLTTFCVQNNLNLNSEPNRQIDKVILEKLKLKI